MVNFLWIRIKYQLFAYENEDNYVVVVRVYRPLEIHSLNEEK